MRRIVNLTRHPSTSSQKKEGVFDVPLELRGELKKLLTFDRPPSKEKIEERATKIEALATYEGVGRCTCGTCWYCNNRNGLPEGAMIGGAPYLLSALEDALKRRGIKPLYAFSKRESVEREVDGEVVKTQVFKHMGFVEV